MTVPEDRSLLVLIDDDELIRMSWSMMAEKKSIGFRAFSTPKAFLKSAISFDAQVYVDVNLAEGVCGLEVAKTLIEDGYHNVFITSGMPRDNLQIPSGVQGVTGKTFPI